MRRRYEQGRNFDMYNVCMLTALVHTGNIWLSFSTDTEQAARCDPRPRHRSRAETQRRLRRLFREVLPSQLWRCCASAVQCTPTPRRRSVDRSTGQEEMGGESSTLVHSSGRRTPVPPLCNMLNCFRVRGCRLTRVSEVRIA